MLESGVFYRAGRYPFPPSGGRMTGLVFLGKKGSVPFSSVPVEVTSGGYFYGRILTYRTTETPPSLPYFLRIGSFGRFGEGLGFFGLGLSLGSSGFLGFAG